MKIKKPELIENNNHTVRVQCPIETRGGERILWYELEARFKDYLTLERLDAFVSGLILFAMQHNEPVEVEGTLSNKLAYNLKYYMHVLKSFYPDWHVVPLKIINLDPLNKTARGHSIGSSFTTGIDSFTTLLDNFKNEKNRDKKITHLLFGNVGQPGGEGMNDRELFQKNLANIKKSAKHLNLDLVVVDSNVGEFYTKDHFSDSHGPRIMSCALLLQKLFSIYYIPSSFKYADIFPQGTTPLADHLLSTEVLEMVHDGAQYSRIEKTRLISDWDVAHSHLTVCNYNFQLGKINCSNCDKCLRTMVTLDMLGKSKNFERVLDYTDFEKKRDLYVSNKFLSRLLGERVFISFWDEIKQYGKKIGYPLRIKPKFLLLAIWLKLTQISSRKFNKMLRRLKSN